MVTVPPETLSGVRYARIAGFAFGAFMVVWGVFGMGRWEGHGYHVAVVAQAAFFVAFGALLLLPWRRLGGTQYWKPLFALVSVMCVIYGFVMVCEVMALNYIADGMHMKAKPPVLQGIQLFIALGQIPTLLFFRKPELLD